MRNKIIFEKKSTIHPSDYLFVSIIHLQKWMPLWKGRTQEEIKKTGLCIQAQITKLKQESTPHQDPSGMIDVI